MTLVSLVKLTDNNFYSFLVYSIDKIFVLQIDKVLQTQSRIDSSKNLSFN